MTKVNAAATLAKLGINTAEVALLEINFEDGYTTFVLEYKVQYQVDVANEDCVGLK